jgi:alkylated DNA repair dioxygenase AlkB
LEEHPILINIIALIEKFLDNKYKFNYILGNRYVDGSHNIGMHSDDERDLNGPIVSISLGASRFFDIKSKLTKMKQRINLKNGSMLIMAGDTQKNYKHGVPIQKKIKSKRINLTFRVVKN